MSTVHQSNQPNPTLPAPLERGQSEVSQRLVDLHLWVSASGRFGIGWATKFRQKTASGSSTARSISPVSRPASGIGWPWLLTFPFTTGSAAPTIAPSRGGWQRAPVGQSPVADGQQATRLKPGRCQRATAGNVGSAATRTSTLADSPQVPPPWVTSHFTTMRPHFYHALPWLAPWLLAGRTHFPCSLSCLLLRCPLIIPRPHCAHTQRAPSSSSPSFI